MPPASVSPISDAVASFPSSSGPSSVSSRAGVPGAEELATWRTFLRAHSQLTRRLEADLLEKHGISLASYDVLVQLVEAPGHRLRMTELAARVLLSRSGVTRLVDRLERDGLVVREACESDARGMFAVLTPRGYEDLRAASRTHLRGVAAYATSRLTPDELRLLGGLLDRFLA